MHHQCRNCPAPWLYPRSPLPRQWRWLWQRCCWVWRWQRCLASSSPRGSWEAWCKRDHHSMAFSLVICTVSACSNAWPGFMGTGANVSWQVGPSTIFTNGRSPARDFTMDVFPGLTLDELLRRALNGMVHIFNVHLEGNQHFHVIREMAVYSRPHKCGARWGHPQFLQIHQATCWQASH